jgi:hypothetical protein
VTAADCTHRAATLGCCDAKTSGAQTRAAVGAPHRRMRLRGVDCSSINIWPK